MDYLQSHNQLTRYLVEQGEIVDWADKTLSEEFEFFDEKVEAVDQELTNLFNDVESEFISEMNRRGIGTQTQRETLISNAFDPAEEPYRTSLTTGGLEMASRGRLTVVNDLQEMGRPGVGFFEMNEAVQEQLENNVDRFAIQTFANRKDEIRQALIQAVNEGKSISRVETLMREEFGLMKSYKFRRVARTELGFANQAAKEESYKDYNVKYKQWLTQRDAKVRTLTTGPFDHVMMHSQVVKRSENFRHPSQRWSLRYPLDRSGNLANIINCRCSTRAFVPPQGMVVGNTPWYPGSGFRRRDEMDSVVNIGLEAGAQAATGTGGRAGGQAALRADFEQTDEVNSKFFGKGVNDDVEDKTTAEEALISENEKIRREMAEEMTQKDMERLIDLHTDERVLRFDATDKESLGIQLDKFLDEQDDLEDAVAEDLIPSIQGQWNLDAKGRTLSNTLQMAARDEFGLDEALVQNVDNVADWELAEEVYEDHEDIIRKFLRLQHRKTQEFLDRQNLDDQITMLRGMALDDEDLQGGLNNIQDAEMNGLQSFTSEEKQAKFFAGRGPGRNDVIVIQTVDRKDIISMPHTGMGAPNESEFVIRGRSKQEIVIDANDDKIDWDDKPDDWMEQYADLIDEKVVESGDS